MDQHTYRVSKRTAFNELYVLIFLRVDLNQVLGIKTILRLITLWKHRILTIFVFDR